MSAAPIPRDIEDRLLPISALQHYLFCPRQCALIHLEQAWAEDARTAEGRVLHEKVDAGQAEARPGVVLARGLSLRSVRLGVSGRADAVELRGHPPVPYPVEYKRGRPKAHRADEVQLCAQAICLEEMFGVAVPEGALYYAAQRRRTLVPIDATLRHLTETVAASARAMVASGKTPAPRHTRACAACSLHDLCLPERLEAPPAVGAWLDRQFARDDPPAELPE